MPACPSDCGLWSVACNVLTWTLVVVAAYAIRSWRLLWFTVRAFNRAPARRVHAGVFRRVFARVTSVLAALWYLKDLLVPRGLGDWLFGNVPPGIPSDHEPLDSQVRAARHAARLLLRGTTRIVIFTGGAGWGKTHTSHDLKHRLAPLTQIDVSWTMISANPEGRLVEEFARLVKTATGDQPVSSSFDQLRALVRRNRARTSPHFFAHVHDFEAIAIESHSLAAARRLIERVSVSPHISLVITTRHDQARLEKLLPVLSSSLVTFIPITERLPDGDVRRLLAPGRALSDGVRLLSPLRLTLLRHYEERIDISSRASATETLGMYRSLFSCLAPAQQVCLQLFLARLVVSPQRLFVRRPGELLARLGDGDPLLRLFAYVEGEGDPVARLAHPTVLQLYAGDEIMSAATRQRRHAQWAEALGGGSTGDSLVHLQRVRHELRARRGRADHEEQITSVTHGGTLAICRFLFECRSDFQEYFPEPAADPHDSPGTILMRHDSIESPDEYVGVVEALVRSSPGPARWEKTRNLVKMMELLYQGLDAWVAASTLAGHLTSRGEEGMVYGAAMTAVFEFDYNADTLAAIASAHEAVRGWQRASGTSSSLTPFTRATMLINEGVFRNNQFRNDRASDAATFDKAEGLYLEARDLITSEMVREDRPEYRLLMLRERLRVSSGLLRWSYLKHGAGGVNVDQAWEAARKLVEHEAGWPTATPLQEFAYFALNASFIELACKGRLGRWREYHTAARHHQEAAGDTWFRLRLDQMDVVAATLEEGTVGRLGGVKTLETVIGEMRGMEDWTGIAFCSYQLAVLRAARIEASRIQEQYELYVSGQHEPTFVTRLQRERLFAILCGDDDEAKAKYFPAWTRSPMPLNLHGLLLLRSVSLLDQVNWSPDRA